MKLSPADRQQLDELLDLITPAARQTSATWADLDEAETPIQWDWPGWLPRGFLTVVASEAGVGKSSLCLHVAASYIDGRAWPDGSPFTARRGKILWVESEGSQRANLERLKNWGLDLPDPTNPDYRRLSIIKNNLAPFSDPLGFRIDDEGR